MRTEFRKAVLAREMRSLLLFDRKAFHQYPADWFGGKTGSLHPWWMLVEGNERWVLTRLHAMLIFWTTYRKEGNSGSLHGSLSIVSTGLLPEFRGIGLR